jgi:hypothetical protein
MAFVGAMKAIRSISLTRRSAVADERSAHFLIAQLAAYETHP